MRYFWDSASGQCKEFRWSGCFGNVPFVSLKECQAAKCNPCVEKPDPGPCRARITRYFYNATTDKCESFTYGGCKGNVPFDELLPCKDTCVENRCKLRPVTGPCRASIPRYFFNQKTGACEMFTWGGCKGVVPFTTLSECQKAGCMANKCRLTGAPGPCRASFRRWFFNTDTGMCEQFIWGGCNGRVPFETEAECKQAMCPVDRCLLKSDSGPCEALIERWFWDASIGRCQSFNWGGCDGVVPFVSQDQCRRAACC